MSTFDGRVIEFPDIRIDYFRVSPKETIRPLAFFLSHVHSDHLQGLDACKSPFIYCTPATKQLLLRLEKYPHRMNFAKGILEARKQTYRHLKLLLKAIPLETPTTLELAPGRTIRVTLFDANHCTGACVFLIEDESHAVLYTGDIRSEQWWVDSLVRQPLLLPYACRDDAEPLKRLDCIYLDTTFATDLAPYKHFMSKKEGVTELLAAVGKYPADTIFYFDTWTFGYEEVWVALSASLRSKIHVDDYRYGMYNALSLAEGPQSQERNQLIGFKLGNHYQAGCLTKSQARLHSCEMGTNCEVFDGDFVRITPIITRYEGVEMAEMGAGGGQGDLDQKHELEVDDGYMLQSLITLCREKLRSQSAVLEQMESLLVSLLSTNSAPLLLDPNVLQPEAHTDALTGQDVPIEALVPAIVKFVDEKRRAAEAQEPGAEAKRRPVELRPDGMPKRITFPYSRHSSYEELRFVIQAFLPKEIYPCTVDQDNWTERESMQHLFADLYPAGKTFRHDNMTRRLVQQRKEIRRLRLQKDREHSEANADLAHKSMAPHLASTASPSVQRPAVEEAEAIGQALSTPEIVTTSSEMHVIPPLVKRALQREAFEAACSDWSSTIELIGTCRRDADQEL